MIISNWRGYKIKILTLNNNNLTDTEINNNIYKTIEKNEYKKI